MRVAFRGNLRALFVLIMLDVKAPERADLLILESTHGNLQHENRQHRRARLEEVINKALRDQGAVYTFPRSVLVVPNSCSAI